MVVSRDNWLDAFSSRMALNQVVIQNVSRRVLTITLVKRSLEILF